MKVQQLTCIREYASKRSARSPNVEEPRPPTGVSDPTGKINPEPARPPFPRRGTTWRNGVI